MKFCIFTNFWEVYHEMSNFHLDDMFVMCFNFDTGMSKNRELYQLEFRDFFVILSQGPARRAGL